MPAHISARHCLVTGANRGLGLEFVRQLLDGGGHPLDKHAVDKPAVATMRVVATCRHPGKATALNLLAGEHPGRLHVLPLDVADPRAIAGLLRELRLLDDDGDSGCLDLLVNCAGVLHSGERFGSVTADNLDDSFRTNAMGPFLLTQALAPRLRDGARVANISSQLGSIGGLGSFGTPSYNISKAAQNMTTVLLADALRARGMVVVALHPGWVQTDMGGAGATLPPAQSVAGLLKVIGALTPAQSGHFLDWHGQPLPW